MGFDPIWAGGVWHLFAQRGQTPWLIWLIDVDVGGHLVRCDAGH